MEFRPVTQEDYDAHSLPLFNRVAKQGVRRRSGSIRPRWGAGRFTAVVDRVKKGVRRDRAA